MDQADFDRHFRAMAEREPIPQTAEERILQAADDVEFLDSLSHYIYAQSVVLVTPTPEDQLELADSRREMQRIEPVMKNRFSLNHAQYQLLIVFGTQKLYDQFTSE